MSDYVVLINDDPYFHIDGYMQAIYETEGITDPVALQNKAEQAATEAGYDPHRAEQFGFPAVPFGKQGNYCPPIVIKWRDLLYLYKYPDSVRTILYRMTETSRAKFAEGIKDAFTAISPLHTLKPDENHDGLYSLDHTDNSIHVIPSRQIGAAEDEMTYSHNATVPDTVVPVHPILWPKLEALGYTRNEANNGWEYKIPDAIKQTITRTTILQLIDTYGAPHRGNPDEPLIPIRYVKQLVLQKLNMPELTTNRIVDTYIANAISEILSVLSLGRRRTVYFNGLQFPENEQAQKAKEALKMQRHYRIDVYVVPTDKHTYNRMARINGVEVVLLGLVIDGRKLVYLHCTGEWRAIQAIKRSIRNGKIEAITYKGLDKTPQKAMTINTARLETGGYELVAYQPTADKQADNRVYLLAHKPESIEPAFNHAMLTACTYPIRTEWLPALFEYAVSERRLRPIHDAQGVHAYTLSPNDRQFREFITNAVQNKELEMPEPIEKETDEHATER